MLDDLRDDLDAALDAARAALVNVAIDLCPDDPGAAREALRSVEEFDAFRAELSRRAGMLDERRKPVVEPMRN